VKKNSKRILAVALVIAMVFSLSAAALAENRTDRPFDYYMCIGDSLPFKNKGDMAVFSKDAGGWLINSYPQLVADYYGLTSKSMRYNGAHAGWRTCEVRFLCDDSYEGDDYLNCTAHTMSWGGYTKADLIKLRPQFRAALRKADLITINLGSNDIIGVLKYAADEVMTFRTAGSEYDKQLMQALEEAKQANSEYEYIVKVLDIMSTLEDYSLLVRNLTTRFFEILTNYFDNWDALMKSVLQWTKEDATIVVIGLFNPTGGVVANMTDISEEAASVITSLTDPGSELFNAYMKSGSPYASEYLYADVFGVDLTGTGDGSHLGQVGHRYFADQIISAVDSTLPCGHNYATELINYRAASKLLCGYSGDVKCSHCGAVIEQGQVTSPTLVEGSFLGTVAVSTAAASLKLLNSVKSLFGI